MEIKPKIGTCSWNYDSWIGLVYHEKSATSAEYLKQYSKKYRTVEIDSWFYALPKKNTVYSYLEKVDADFSFTCKVSNYITLSHFRDHSKSINPDFLSPVAFNEYLDAIEPMLSRLDAIMFEFEYLNKEKMPSCGYFLNRLDKFLRQVPSDLPLAMETRNKNYLQKDYFELLRNHDVMHVFSEKLYMPHVYEVYDRYADLLTDGCVIRLLGGDRRAIEKATNQKWDTIVEPKSDLNKIAAMVNDMIGRGMTVTINVNNHYEGSAPLTIKKLGSLL